MAVVSRPPPVAGFSLCDLCLFVIKRIWSLPFNAPPLSLFSQGVQRMFCDIFRLIVNKHVSGGVRKRCAPHVRSKCTARLGIFCQRWPPATFAYSYFGSYFGIYSRKMTCPAHPAAFVTVQEQLVRFDLREQGIGRHVFLRMRTKENAVQRCKKVEK